MLLRHYAIDIHKSYVVERVAKAYFYPDAESLQRYGHDSISFNPEQEDLRILEAVTLRPDGQRLELDPATADINDPDTFDTFDTFDDTKQLILNSPGLTPGSVSVLVYEKRYTGERPYFFNTPIKSSMDIESIRVSVSWSGDSPNISYPSDLLDCSRERSRLDCSATKPEPVFLTIATTHWMSIPSSPLHRTRAGMAPSS